MGRGSALSMTIRNGLFYFQLPVAASDLTAVTLGFILRTPSQEPRPCLAPVCSVLRAEKPIERISYFGSFLNINPLVLLALRRTWMMRFVPPGLIPNFLACAAP
jgi:hypothetical protein